ncbi:MAG TPA: hypothetical protein PK644_03375, partial [bacterium]|nr:hypothetical protein [bacterium]
MRTKLQNDCFALEAQPSRVEQVFLRYQGQRFLLGDLIYHFKYWQQAGASSFHQVFLPTLRWNCRQAIREGKIADKGFCRLVYDLSSENRLQVCCSFTADREVTIGFYCWGLKPPENVTGLRLLPGVYSGYTLRPGLTALFRFAYSESKGPGQAALAVDQTRCWFGTTRTAYQYLCLSFPPAYKDGVFRVHRGETVTGKLLISQARPDIWNPVFKEEEYASEEKLEFLPPRYPYSLYLDYFSTFARQPSLWVPLGKGMGLYHVGYYGHLTRVKRGGPYGYACQGRPLRYRQLAEWLEKKRPGLSHFQENTRQLEIAWGNGTNAMVAYALLLLGKPWSVSRGREIVQAILRFGFLISRGPLSGAWWGAYNVDR